LSKKFKREPFPLFLIAHFYEAIAARITAGEKSCNGALIRRPTANIKLTNPHTSWSGYPIGLQLPETITTRIITGTIIEAPVLI
jgi:hypothetical protein